MSGLKIKSKSPRKGTADVGYAPKSMFWNIPKLLWFEFPALRQGFLGAHTTVTDPPKCLLLLILSARVCLFPWGPSGQGTSHFCAECILRICTDEEGTELVIAPSFVRE
jgi:hypothetical protein